MVTITTQTEETILKCFNEVAQQQITLEEVTQEALRVYLQNHSND